MADAAKRASARSISAVIAHYGYARQDRKAAPREPITAKLVADLLEVSGIDNIITVDLHQDAIQGFFDIPVNHMTAMPIFVDYFRNKGFDPERLCVVSPDVGRAKAAKKFSTALDCDIAIMHKDRPKHNQAEITALIGDVTDKICILNDDIDADTGGSLVAAAATLKAKAPPRCTPALPTACSPARPTSVWRTPASRKWWSPTPCPCRSRARPARSRCSPSRRCSRRPSMWCTTTALLGNCSNSCLAVRPESPGRKPVLKQH